MINRFRRMILLACLAFPLQAAQARDRDMSGKLSRLADRFIPDVAYSNISLSSNLMDIYVPQGVGPHPMVLWIHGGAFWGGDKRDQGALIRALPGLMAADIAVVAVNYRLSGEAVWPAQREDLAAALAFLRVNAGAYDCDADRLAVFGTSAGATLALILGLDEAASGRNILKAVAAWYPATLFTEMDSDMEKDQPVPQSELMARKGSMISRLVGEPLGKNPENALEASPISLLAKIPADQLLPPFLVAAGADDRTISWRQSQRFATALRQRSNPPPVDFTVYPNSGHGSGAFEGVAIQKLVAFLAQHLR